MPNPFLDPFDPDYPDSDGQPIADSTAAFRWIGTIQGSLDAAFIARPDVAVFGCLLYYPIQGRPEVRTGPDVMVVFGRPKGHRHSYRVWEEGGVIPQVTFEVFSPEGRADEVREKYEFYQRHGIEEYYAYSVVANELAGYRRDGQTLLPIPHMDGWVSPRLGIRFDLSGAELRIFGPDGRRFLSYVELLAQIREER